MIDLLAHKQSLALLFLAAIVSTSLLLLFSSAASAAPVDLAKTGQTTCYNQTGVAIDCAGTGQDGDLQTGEPMPDTRFIDNADGTVTDNLTGLVWLQNASCFGPRIWWDALLDANNLAGGVRVNTSYAQSHLHPGRAWARLEVRC